MPVVEPLLAMLPHNVIVKLLCAGFSSRVFWTEQNNIVGVPAQNMLQGWELGAAKSSRGPQFVGNYLA